MTTAHFFKTMESTLSGSNYCLIAANVLLAVITAADLNLIAAAIGIGVTLMGNAYKIVEGWYKLSDLIRSHRAARRPSFTDKTDAA